MQIHPLTDSQLSGLMQNPELFPIRIEIENDYIFFLEVSEQDLIREPFHDQRLLNKESIVYGSTIKDLLNRFNIQIANIPPQRLIFHSAFCGSTLLSRYLDELQSSFVYREPQVFMELADFKHSYDACMDHSHWSSVQSLLIALLSRSPKNTKPIIKLVDNCNDLATGLLSLNSHSRGLALYSSLDDFLLSCLKMPERRHFAKQRLAGMDLKSSSAFSEVDSGGLSEPESIACLWILQMQQLTIACRENTQQLGTIPRMTLISKPEESLRATLKFFDLGITDEALNLLILKHSKVHSKSGQEFILTADDNTNEQIKRRHNVEITEAKLWADTFLCRHPVPEVLPNRLL